MTEALQAAGWAMALISLLLCLRASSLVSLAAIALIILFALGVGLASLPDDAFEQPATISEDVR